MLTFAFAESETLSRFCLQSRPQFFSLTRVDFLCRLLTLQFEQSCRDRGLITEMQSFDATTGLLPLAFRPRGFRFQPGSPSFSCPIERIQVSWVAFRFPWVPGLLVLPLPKRLGGNLFACLSDRLGRSRICDDGAGPRLDSHRPGPDHLLLLLLPLLLFLLLLLLLHCTV